MKRQPWKILETTDLLKTPIFRLRTDKLELPDGRVMPRYFVMELSDWVNIIPVTADRQIVMVEQYRHATKEYTLEFPGGAAEHHSIESAEKAAIRELEEETGYVPGRVELLAKQSPNPALQSNIAHSFIAFDCTPTGRLNPDIHEDIEIVTKSIPEVYELILKGHITHSIMVAAFLHALPHFKNDLR